MYNPHFNFSCSPFENTLDQRFLFFSECHDEVISALLYFIKEQKSFALVCGDVGTGKTMIVHHLLSKLPRSVQPILIPFPDVEYIEILRYISRVLKINPADKGILELADEVKAALINANLDGRQFILIIDEAHLLSKSSLEHIRLLSNIEVTENKLLQILLIGQNELSYNLRGREMRQLRQRVNVNRVLSPMSASETIAYIDHRLKVAGSSFDTCFEPGCGKSIFEMTGGVPRSINQLCDTALLICMTTKGERVTRRILKKAHDALRSDVILTPAKSTSGALPYRNKLKPALAGGVLLLLLALGGVGYMGNPGENLKNLTSGPASSKSINSAPVTPQPPVPEIRTEETATLLKGEKKSLSGSTPDAEKLRTPNLASASPEVPPKEAEPAENKDENVMAPFAALSPIADAGLNPAAQEETQAREPVPNANQTPAETQTRETGPEIASASGNSNPDAQDPRTGKKALVLLDSFTIKVKNGETLAGIARRFFPENPTSGQASILFANPEIGDKNRIYVGQVLRIPKAREIASEKQ